MVVVHYGWSSSTVNTNEVHKYTQYTVASFPFGPDFDTIFFLFIHTLTLTSRAVVVHLNHRQRQMKLIVVVAVVVAAAGSILNL